MKTRIFSMMLACLLLLVIVSCDFAGGASSKGVNLATSKAAVKIRIPTNTPMPPTATIPPEDVIKDVTGVRLALEDFPDGYKAMSFTDLDQMGMTPSQLAASFTKDLTKAQIHNASGFMHQEGMSMDIVLSLIIYPLTGLETSSFDMALSDPQKFFSDFGAPGGSDVRTLDGAQEIGDKTIAIDYKVEQESPEDVPSRGQIVFSRRGNALLLIFNIYLNRESPGVDSVELARKLDARLVEALAR